jgi:hypothetical protein
MKSYHSTQTLHQQPDEQAGFFASYRQGPPPLDLQERKDQRITFNGGRLIMAECGTLKGYFKAPLRDLSTSGAFILTDRPLHVGNEITLDFLLHSNEKPIKITGEIVRKTYEGVGVEFKIIFKY